MSFTSNNWFVAGNALGDHTSGGFITSTSEASLSSLTTFDGDFEIQFTATDLGAGIFGVAEIAADSSRASNNHHGMNTAIESFAYSEVDQGGGQGSYSYNYGNSSQANSQIVDTSVIKITRVSGVISFFDDDSLKHEFTQTNSNPMRFFMGSTATDVDIDDILFTDTDKIQREGSINQTSTGSISTGAGGPNDFNGSLLQVSRSGGITEVQFEVDSMGSNFDSHIEVWSHDGTNPLAQLGGDSSTVNLSSAGVKTWTFSTTPTVIKNQYIWVIIVDDTGTGVANMKVLADMPDGQTAGRSNSIAAMSDNLTSTFLCGVKIDTSDGEPTPDHDTLLLIHSDTSDGSTTFVDSSPTGASITSPAGGNAQHDTAQTLGFGTSSMLFDGTGDDYLTVPNHASFNNMSTSSGGNLTFDATIRIANTGVQKFIGTVGSAAAWANLVFMMEVDNTNKLFVQIGNNGGTGTNITGGTSLTTGVNYHVAFVKLGSDLRIYLDGTSDGYATSALTLSPSTHPFVLGADARLTSSNFNGWIKEPRFSNVARWDADFTPPTANYS
jgi:hypothetical protein